MGYSDQINILKKSLEGYNSEEKKLSDLYKTAIANAEKSTKDAIGQLQKDYHENRNEAYADSARNERNLNNALAARGLGFSGESAQAKINANVALSGRLSDLAKAKTSAEQKYNSELADRISNLSMEEAEKLKELINNKNQMNLQIASLELNRENAEADRQAEKDNLASKLAAEKQINDDNLRAERNRQNTQISADLYNLWTKLDAEKEMQDASLLAEKNRQQTQIEADMQSLLTKLAADKEINNANIQADKDKQKTQIEADLQSLLTKLAADKEMNNANIQADKDKQKTQIEADLQSLLTKLAADKEINNANIQADKDKQKTQIEADLQSLLTKLAADKEINDAKLSQERKELLFAMSELNAKIALEKEKLEADKDMLNTKLKAEQEALITKLENEKDMLEKELIAKYYSSSSGSGSGSSSGGGGSSSGTSYDGNGYTPDITAKDLAKQITGGKRLEGEDGEYAVDKFLLNLKTNYNINSDYYDDLLLMLESFGYSENSESEMRTNVITYEAKSYDSDDEYNKYYNYYVTKGYVPYQAKAMARKDITSNQMEFIHKNCKSNTEFKTCCIALGISQTVYNEYLNNLSTYGKVEKYN